MQWCAGRVDPCCLVCGGDWVWVQPLQGRAGRLDTCCLVCVCTGCGQVADASPATSDRRAPPPKPDEDVISWRGGLGGLRFCAHLCVCFDSPSRSSVCYPPLPHSAPPPPGHEYLAFPHPPVPRPCSRPNFCVPALLCSLVQMDGVRPCAAPRVPGSLAAVPSLPAAVRAIPTPCLRSPPRVTLCSGLCQTSVLSTPLAHHAASPLSAVLGQWGRVLRGSAVGLALGRLPGAPFASMCAVGYG